MNTEKSELNLEALERVSGSGKDTVIVTTHLWRQMHMWAEVTPHRLTFRIFGSGPK